VRRVSGELVALVLLSLVFLAAAVWRERSKAEGSRHVGPTAFSYRPNGLRAFYELCQRRGIPVTLVLKDLTKLPKNTRVVVLAEPLRRAVSVAEKQRLDRWVDQGGILLLIADETAGVDDGHRPDGLETVSAMFPPRAVAVESSDPLLRDVRVLSVGRGPVLVLSRPALRPLLSDRYGVLIATERRGSGQVVVISAALAPTNRLIGQGDNAVLYMNIVETRRGGDGIAFSEVHHMAPIGAHDQGRWWRALPASIQAAGWILMLIVLAAIWNGNHRFGRTSTELAAHAASPQETAGSLYVTSMARLLRRARCPELAVEYIHRAFEKELAKRAGHIPGETPRSLAGAANMGHGLGDRVSEVLDYGREIVGGGKTSEERLLWYAQQVAALRKELGLV